MGIMIAKPLIGVDSIKFGMLRLDLRNILGDFKEFKKSEFSKNTTDDFSFCHVYYDDNDKVEAVEIFSGTNIKVYEERILPNTSEEAYKIIKLLDKETEIDGDYYTSVKLSIGITCENGSVESVVFGKENYYK